jgi:hypothetical protein
LIDTPASDAGTRKGVEVHKLCLRQSLEESLRDEAPQR